ncbi:MAG: hypothetical protein IJC18_03615, partial [Clostridia bacterium]|nr:hypothetical protein [Clostridia bacterium]
MKNRLLVRVAAALTALCIAFAMMPMRASAEDAPRSGEYAVGGDVYYIDAESAAVMCRGSGGYTEVILDDGKAMGLFSVGDTLYASVMRDNTPCRVTIAFLGGSDGRTF